MAEGRRVLFQTAYFVSDLDRAIHEWNRLYGAGPFAVSRHHRMERMSYRGRDLGDDERPDLSYALGYLGDLMIQFTQQHDDRPSVYRDMYARGQEGFHHVAYLVGDIDAESERLSRAGFVCGCRFHADGAEGAYFDTRPAIGAFTEIHTEPPQITEAFAAWRRAHELWRPGDALIIGG